jgi:carbonic anhydrase/acetyltransferase-like protein (isoleucine patch superfamily)
MDEFLDAARIGRVVIHEGCSFGPRCVVLCNVEVGPRTTVAAGSVVVSSLPPDTYCAGAPARVVSGRAEYLEGRRAEMASRPAYTRADLARLVADPSGRAAVRAAVEEKGGYVRGEGA